MSRHRAPARWLAPPDVDATAAATLAAALAPIGDRADRLPLPAAVVRLLVARGVTAPEAAKRFLRPSLDHLAPPEVLAGLPKAAERLADAVRRRERILVHGDYDVDGICSVALLTRVLRTLGGDVVPFIPNRLRDGYDLGPAGVEAARAEGARVVLTCDCGTTALAPIAALKAMGVDVIVSDHHRPAESLPDAYVIVNPQCEARVGSDRDLAAVGVAWKLALAVTRLLGGSDDLVAEQLPLVALATVADVAPLTGDNRILVKEGLRRMTEAPSHGLRALIRASRTDEKRLTAGRLGFTLGPRLNALGRLGSALRGVELLLADDAATANAIARECEELNERRQAMDRKILDEAKTAVAAMDLSQTYGIVLHSRDWHAGVIGIVASRVVELTGRPTMLIAIDGTVGKGSGRSISRFDLHATLVECGALLTKFGGHRMAAGLTIDESAIPAFAEQFNAVARAKLTADDFVPELRTDIELPFDEADDALERALRHLEPYGVGNPGPVLVSRGVTVAVGARRVGAEGVKLHLARAGGSLEALGWSLGARGAELGRDARVDIAYRLERNEYQGRETLQATLLDVKPADADG